MMTKFCVRDALKNIPTEVVHILDENNNTLQLTEINSVNRTLMDLPVKTYFGCYIVVDTNCLDVFIISPMRDSPQESLKHLEDISNKVRNHFKDKNVHIILPEIHHKNDQRISYLVTSITRMTDADLVIIDDDINFSKRCCIESTIANSYNIRTMSVNELKD